MKKYTANIRRCNDTGIRWNLTDERGVILADGNGFDRPGNDALAECVHQISEYLKANNINGTMDYNFDLRTEAERNQGKEKSNDTISQ